MPSRPTTVLVGLGSTALTAFEALSERFAVQALVRPGSDETVQRAREAGVRVEGDSSVAAVSALIDEVRPDIVVVSSYNRILPARILELRPFVNVHYAPLPRYRGRSTVNWAILNGETETAISIHCLTEGLDAGGLLVQRFVPIGPRDTVSDLYHRLNALQRELLAGAVERRLGGDAGTPQDETAATYCCGRIPSDGMIDWSASTVSVDRLVRSLGGDFPSAFSYLADRRIEILGGEPVTNGRTYVGRVPGRVAAVDRRIGTVDVLTGDGTLRIQSIRLLGARPQAPAEIITSTRMTLGLPLPGLLMPSNGQSSARTDIVADFVPTLVAPGTGGPEQHRNGRRRWPS